MSPNLPDFRRMISILTLASALAGCAPVPFVPISWGMRERVLALSREDVALSILYARYDPKRVTLRIDGPSFDEFETLDNGTSGGSYRPDAQLIYRNSEHPLAGKNLRDIILHEFAHHIWFRHMTQDQKKAWCKYLELHPNRWQLLVRTCYRDPRQYDSEDFAYTVEFARSEDIAELAALKIISPEEGDRWRQALSASP